MENDLTFIEKKSSKRVLPKKNDDAKLDRAKKLTHLYMHSNGITEIGDISACEKLTVLYLHDNEIGKIENLDSAANLQSLYLQRNKISKIENLQKLAKLQKLYLGHNRISVIEGLENLTNLQELHVEKQTLKNGDGLCFDPRTICALVDRLQILNISHNSIASIKDLTPLKCLQQINASHNLIRNLKDTCKAINGWYYLREATFTGNPMSKVHRYRESIIGSTERLTLLDGKQVNEMTRDFIKCFEYEKKHHGLAKQVNIADDIKGIPKNYPLPLQKAVTVSLLNNIKKNNDQLMTTENLRDETQHDSYIAWNAMPKKSPLKFSKNSNSVKSHTLKDVLSLRWQM